MLNMVLFFLAKYKHWIMPMNLNGNLVEKWDNSMQFDKLVYHFSSLGKGIY